EHLKQLVSNLPVILFSIDRDGRFTLSEGQGLELLGLKPGQVVGTSVYELYRDEPRLLASIRRALSGAEFTETLYLERPALHWRTLYRQETDADGNVRGVIGLALDV